MRVVIRRIGADEGPLLMRTRLMALLDAPYAFSGTYTDAIQRPTERWAERATASSSGGSEAMFVALAEGDPIGMAGAYTPADRPATRQVVSVWVEPVFRGQGLAARLVGSVLEWAELAGATELDLWVAEANEPAFALYRALGFEDSGDRQTMASNPAVTEHRLVRPS